MPDNLPAIVEPTPLVLIQQAITSGMKPADLRELFELQRDHSRDLAERAYADAITAFQCECPPIRKTADNKGTGKKYADYEHIMRTIMPLLRRHRIVISWDTKEEGGKMLVICRVRVGTVEKLTTVAMPTSAASTKMNEQQASGGAVTYGRRYAIVAALNLFDTDQDDDGQNYTPSEAVDEHTVETISVPQQDEIDALLRPAGFASDAGINRLFTWIGRAQGAPCKGLADVRLSALSEVLNFLRRKRDERIQADAKAKAGGAA